MSSWNNGKQGNEGWSSGNWSAGTNLDSTPRNDNWSTPKSTGDWGFSHDKSQDITKASTWDNSCDNSEDGFKTQAAERSSNRAETWPNSNMGQDGSLTKDRNGWEKPSSSVHNNNGSTFQMDAANISKHAGGDFEAPKDNACRNCGTEGHFARECPEPKKLTGECYNCGEVGHNKADCPNPAISRPFTGTCRVCGKEGHRAVECPNKPPVQCRNCLKEGHIASECKENRVVDTSNIPDHGSDTAWDMIKTASEERDLDDLKSAVEIYCKANKEVTYPDLEKKFREAGLKFYIIGLEKEIPNTMTIVNLQGKTECKYVVGFFFSPKPKSPVLAKLFPSSPEENLGRLEDAGVVMEGTVPVCRNCNERGHMSKACPQERVERLRPEKYDRCINCLATGHILRDCPEERVDRSKRCRNCDEAGHMAKDCEKPRNTANVECNKCHEIGHFARDCPSNDGKTLGGAGCRNCGEEGHFARECDKPKNPANVQCRNCDKFGHFSRECPEPRDWSRVKCTYCDEMGHTSKRCPKMADEGQGHGSFDKENSGFDSSFNNHGGDSWGFSNDESNKGRDSGWGGSAVDNAGEWKYEPNSDANNASW